MCPFVCLCIMFVAKDFKINSTDNVSIFFTVRYLSNQQCSDPCFRWFNLMKQGLRTSSNRVTRKKARNLMARVVFREHKKLIRTFGGPTRELTVLRRL